MVQLFKQDGLAQAKNRNWSGKHVNLSGSKYPLDPFKKWIPLVHEHGGKSYRIPMSRSRPDIPIQYGELTTIHQKGGRSQ